MMSGIRGRDTKPEILIRKGLFRRGFRYRLHVSSLPGKPDLYFPRYKAIILINGCFWHQHDCHLFKWPKTRAEFWSQKIRKNVARDKKNICIYTEHGLRVMRVWECALKGKYRLDKDSVLDIIEKWLIDGQGNAEISCVQQIGGDKK